MSDDKKYDISVVSEKVLPVLAIRNSVLFPGVITPLDVGREKSTAMLEHLPEGQTIAIFSQLKPEVQEPGQDDLYEVGVEAKVLKKLRHSSGNYSVIVKGLSRIVLGELHTQGPFLQATVFPLNEVASDDTEVDALVMSLRELAKDVIRQMPDMPRDAAELIDSVQDPGNFADLIAANLDAPVKDKMSLLETLSDKDRLKKVLKLLTRQLEILKMRARIDSQIKEEMGRNQREYVLRQQLKAIKEELGEDGDQESDLDALQDRILEADLPTEPNKVCRKQLKRLRTMQPGSAEYNVVLNYLDWVLDIPWERTTPDNLDIRKVRDVLEADHSGLEKIKKRIVEYLAVRKLKDDKKGPILCLLGPPGVGKTSLGKSVARAIGRKFHRISLGGVRDEASIRGHRRTYVGALPGQIIHGMKKVGTVNPVLLLDEIDKISSDHRGDPSAALLEVLDPNQNDSFLDHYLDIPYDLSQVMFIATANSMDTIPAPLRDRMEIIELPGYTRKEKLEIAKSHLVPKEIEDHGVDPSEVAISDEALQVIINGHTREAGVRNLRRQVGAVLRGIAVKVAEGEAGPFEVLDEEDLKPFLGPSRFSSEITESCGIPGIATGLAWTPVGGEILFIEATRMPGKGKLQLTGQLGDVMRESAQAALSYVRANAANFAIPENFLEEQDIHIHVPAGAMPKDGPSAGITMCTALVSLLTGNPIHPDIAMSGEITLRGRVMPVGGVKEKVIAAHRAGAKRVILPEKCMIDLEEVPDEIKEEVEFIAASKVGDVLAVAIDWGEPVCVTVD